MNTIYDSIELTETEVQEALLERKKRKFFHLKNKSYWESLESKKGKTKVISYLSHTENKECISPSASPTPGHGFRS